MFTILAAQRLNNKIFSVIRDVEWVTVRVSPIKFCPSQHLFWKINIAQEQLLLNPCSENFNIHYLLISSGILFQYLIATAIKDFSNLVLLHLWSFNSSFLVDLSDLTPCSFKLPGLPDCFCVYFKRFKQRLEWQFSNLLFLWAFTVPGQSFFLYTVCKHLLYTTSVHALNHTLRQNDRICFPDQSSTIYYS